MTHTLTLDEVGQKTAIQRTVAMLLCCVLCLSLFMLCSVNIALCGDTDPINAISTAVSQLTTKIYTTMRKIITPIVAVVFAFAGIQFVIGGKNAAEKARTLMTGGCIGIFLVIFAPLIANEVATWGVDFGGGDLNQYNPLA